MISSLFSAYLNIQVVVSVAVLSLGLVYFWTRALSASAQLKLHYAVLALVLFSPAFFLIGTGPKNFEPIVKVWNPSTASAGVAQVDASASHGVLVVGGKVAPGADYLFLFALGLCLGSLGLGFYNMVRGQLALRKLIGSAFHYKRIRRVVILISDASKIPFSYRSLRFAYVVVPSYLLDSPLNFSLAVRHELQHHRQRDTSWTYPRLLLAAFGVMNPFIYFWNRWIDEVQEFACDEALVGRQNLQARAYARCLIQVAETAWVQEIVPVGATGMILLGQGQLLNRRIQTMFQEPKFHGRLAWLAPLALVGTLMASAAFAAKGLVQDRRVTMAQAQALVKNVKSDIPIRVNEDVLQWLNYFVGTQEGRRTAQEGLRRMEIYRPMIEAKIKAYHVPMELMAIPLIETCYKNLPESNNQSYGVGIWSFIATTARRFGLRVDKNLDERLIEERETEAAMRYLLSNKLLFDDWELAIISYNVGENYVRSESKRLGTEDAWELIAKGNFKRETRDYLPKLNAAILIMNSPSLVQ